MKATIQGVDIEATPLELAQLLDIIQKAKATYQPFVLPPIAPPPFVPYPWPTYPEPYPTIIYDTNAKTYFAPDGSIDYPAWTSITDQLTQHLDQLRYSFDQVSIPSLTTEEPAVAEAA